MGSRRFEERIGENEMKKAKKKKKTKSPDLCLTLEGQVLVEERVGDKIISSYPISGECVLTILNQQLDEAMKLFCSDPEFRKKIEQDVKSWLKTNKVSANYCDCGCTKKEHANNKCNHKCIPYGK